MPLEVEEHFVAYRAGLLYGLFGMHQPFLIVAVHVSHVIYHFSEGHECFVTMLALGRIVHIELTVMMVLVLVVECQGIELSVAVHAAVIPNGAMVYLVHGKRIVILENSKAVIAYDLLFALGRLPRHFDAVLCAQMAVQFHLQMECFVTNMAFHSLWISFGVADQFFLLAVERQVTFEEFKTAEVVEAVVAA